MSLLNDGAAISDFVYDDRAFRASIEGRFASLDADGDGLISFAEMAEELMSLKVLQASFDVAGTGLSHRFLVELHRDIFARFDRDGSRATVDLEEFEDEMKEMLMAVAGFLSEGSENKWSRLCAKL
ncbi:hypothetical protein AXF42_Ash008405 [Apostasia shenzhenica]|uniref:EF-hand domain-containing protein n=1 Tax=Apostasia shenzhenica TaxID=1088818 RepID=A0A2I0AXU3_9ASPA|nr:hypothetical protein AXF42_Ash008405 [Apostasia shenzhenica]